ncbi:MAG: VWA domain-containing protein [Gammaproteobacteria bacterium]|nr:VWA domain-containing protein [Gammaproteobacteria bacterium]MBU1554844.1 VWA domain-containing protein [Gammaproteobacteria bacterium]MBU2071795.1 VWA domain-containing protein [Gammaproteobacteria bacterium]MBU2184137.1 VWA domain-containing protein [Gammaproteobacteria bacterium]MBU2204290.1 VWA domain-containing protein [Gammaproteobacteria bacterium]
MLEFGYPWLALAVLLPLLLRMRRQSGSETALKLPALAKLAGNTAQSSGPRFGFRTVLASLLWLALVTAAMQPRWLGEPVTLPQQGRDLMLALDLSGSMEIADMQLQGQSINRLDAVKLVISDFIRRRQGDRIGLILFADAAYQQTPLTFDLTTVQKMLDDSVLRLVGTRTAIGEAIGLAVKRLNTYESSNKVLILLSDGANTAGNIQPLEALQLAKAAGVKIHTVGVGAEQMVQHSVLGRRMVNPSQDLDERLLTQLAEDTGGRYFRARDLNELNQIYQLIDQLEPIERDTLTYRPQRSLLHWPLALALLISFVMAVVNIYWRGIVKHVV